MINVRDINYHLSLVNPYSVPELCIAILKSFKHKHGHNKIASVDIYKFVSDGGVIEHLDQMQPVPDPNTVVNTYGMFRHLNN